MDDNDDDADCVIDRPAFVSIARWCDISGLGRTHTYQLLAAGRLQAVKAGTRTLVELEPALGYLRSLPRADIRLPKTMARIAM